jgi:hypothetical protein
VANPHPLGNSGLTHAKFAQGHHLLIPGQAFLSVRLLKTLDFRRTPDRAGRFPDGNVFIKRFLRLRLSLGRQMASETPFQRLPQILQHVEAVRALDRLGSACRSSRSIVSSTIPTDQRDFWMGGHPGGCVFCFAVSQDIDHLVCLQIDEDGAEPASPFEGKIIDAKLDDWFDRLCGQGHDAPKNGESAGLDPHTICDAHTQSAASGQANDLDQLKQSCRHPRTGCYKGGEALHKDLSWTAGDIAEKFAHREQEAHRLSSTGEINQFALIATMNTAGRSAT